MQILLIIIYIVLFIYKNNSKFILVFNIIKNKIILIFNYFDYIII